MQIVLYGFGGAEDQFKALAAFTVYEEQYESKRGIEYIARNMRMNNPSIKEVYWVPNRRGLFYEYKASLKKNNNPIETCYTFKNMVEYEGWKVKTD